MVLTRTSSGRARLARVMRAAPELLTVSVVAEALGLPRSPAAKLLSRWQRQGWVKRMRRGVYSRIPVDAVTADRTVENPWVLVPALFGPAYVGGWSAAEYWDLTEQIFRDICVFTTRAFRSQRQEVEGLPFILHRIPEKAMFGTRTVWEGRTRIQISDRERTLLDLLDRPDTGGGIEHVLSCLERFLAASESSLPRLLEYAGRLGNGAVFKRLGYLLERSGHPDAEAREACRARLTRGVARLDPSMPTPRIVTRWRLRVPEGWQRGRARS